MKAKVYPLKDIIKQKVCGIINRLSENLNNYKVEKKLRILYIYCVLLPLIITDSVILAVIIRADKASTQYELENIFNATKYNLTTAVENAVTISNNLYTNRYIDDFLNREYESPLEYYNAFQYFLNNTLLTSSIAAGRTELTIYVDNSTIVNGGEFIRLDDTVRKSEWYQYLMDSGRNRALYIYFDESNTPAINGRRKISLLRKMDFYQEGHEKILKLDINYGDLVNNLKSMNYDVPVYICNGRSIIFSNKGHSSAGKPFKEFKDERKVGYSGSYSVYGQEIVINVLKKNNNTSEVIWNNIPIILLLICINIVLPWLFMKVINLSFTGRLKELGTAFDCSEDERLQEVRCIEGKDEIGLLMRNYNQMVSRINDLIQTVYKDKMKEQEINIARQNAELLALHSQINPHFLFNALDSIRMHSIIKGERETAYMVERLAVMERQYVDWGTDSVTIEEEMSFVEAYLELQKYRFGDRLSYSLEVDKDCKNYEIPKLTIVTFVENTCVHGVENKSVPGWVFVRIFSESDILYLEIEDTGNGIPEPFLSELKEKMAHAGIASLKKKGHVGIMNACLRLRMMTDDKVRFELESEEGAGTIVTVKIPLSCISNKPHERP